MTIMVVDNNFVRLFKLEQCLREAFPEDKIKIFYDPLLALKFCLQHDVDVIFTEIDMHRINGSMLAQGIRRWNKTAKVFFLTEPGTQPNSLDISGVSGCLARSVTENGIHEIIETIRTGGIIE